MSQHEPHNALPEPRRKELFQALVEAQDRGEPVERSRELVAESFGVSAQDVRQVEREGLDKGWPPL